MPKIPFTALATPGKIGKYSVQSLATDFSKASHYAFSSERTLVFYSVGSRLYAYDYNPGHERVQDLGDWGGEITMLKFNIQGCYEESVRPWTAHKETINDLYIATYNTPDGGRNKPGCNRGDIRSESRLDRPWQDSEYGLAE